MISTSLYGGSVILDFLPAKHRYMVGDKVIPSVTQILGIIEKKALLYWAVNQAVEYTLKHFSDIQAGTLKPQDINLSTIQAESKTAHEKVSGEAKDVGSAVHHTIKEYLSDKNIFALIMEKIRKDDDSDNVKNGFNAFLKWERGIDFQTERSEFAMYSKKYNYAGTGDVLGFSLTKKRMLIDFKTFNDDDTDPAKLDKTMKNLPYKEHILQLAAYKTAHEEESGTKIQECHVLYLGKKRGTFLDCKVKVGKAERDAFLSALKIYQWERGNGGK